MKLPSVVVYFKFDSIAAARAMTMYGVVEGLQDRP